MGPTQKENQNFLPSRNPLKSAHELLHEIVELYEIAKRIQNQTKNILICTALTFWQKQNFQQTNQI